MQTFKVNNIKCASCVEQIEDKLSQFDKDVFVNYATKSVSINASNKQLEDIKKLLKNMGYPASSSDNKNTFKTLIVVLLLTAILFGIVMLNMFMPDILPILMQIQYAPILNITIQIVLTFSALALTTDIYKSGFKNLISGYPSMYSLIAIGTSFALTYSLYSSYKIFLGDMSYIEGLYFETVAMILSLVLLGAYIEKKMGKKTSKALEKLLNLKPKMALFLLGDKEIEVPVQKLKIGDTIVVKAGMSIPVDGEIIDGKSSIDESMITGESIEVSKQVGDKVISSSINKNGVLKIKVTTLDKDSTINQIIDMVQQAQSKKAKTTKIADIFSKYFVWSVIFIAIASFVVWYFIVGSTFSFALYISITILIIACPCAIGLATPVSIMVALGHATSKHILIKNIQSLEIMSKLNVIVLDKTGTITNGTPKLVEAKNISNKDIDISTISSSLASKSTHPLSQAIKQDIKLLDVKDFVEYEGMGIVGTIQDNTYYLGNKKLFAKYKINIKDNTWHKTAMSHIFFGDKDGLLAIFYIKDTIKQSSKEAIKQMQQKGIEVYMISGDNKDIAYDIASEVGIKNDFVFAEVLPKQKADLVKKISNKNKKVGFVGDGINDSIALSTADVGFAIGAGSDIAIESSDVVLTRSSLLDVSSAMSLGKYTISNIKQNLFFAIIYNSIGIIIASGILYEFIGVLMSPMIAAFAMMMSSISVLSNALRLKFRLEHI